MCIRDRPRRDRGRSSPHRGARRGTRGPGARWWWLLALCAACAAHPAPSRPAASGLQALVDREWAWRIQEFPQLASRAGVREADDRLDHVDAATQQRHLAHWRAIAAELAALRPDGLSAAD